MVEDLPASAGSGSVVDLEYLKELKGLKGLEDLNCQEIIVYFAQIFAPLAVKIKL
jgi:hypothetical protein